MFSSRLLVAKYSAFLAAPAAVPKKRFKLTQHYRRVKWRNGSGKFYQALPCPRVNREKIAPYPENSSLLDPKKN